MVDLLSQSIENTVQPSVVSGTSHAANILMFLSKGGDIIPSWWSVSRDIELRKFWKRSDHLSGALYTMIAKLTTIPLNIVARDMSIKSHVQLAEEWTKVMLDTPQFGEGWETFYSSFLEDLLGQDNGGFFEIIGRGEKDQEIVGMPITIAHLDSQRCLGRDTRVTLDDGKTMSIIDIVESRYDGYVLSMNDSGVIEPQRVMGWHATKLGERYWIKITLNKSHRTFGRPESVWFTNDHEIFTQNGWKKAEDISYTDKIATQHFDFNNKQKSFLCGSMLGDGHLTKNDSRYPNTSCIQFGHGIKQVDWMKKKINILNPLRFGSVRYVKSTIRGKENLGVKAQSIYSPLLREYRELWYKDGKKIVPREFVEKYFSDELLACWYMDDGTLTIRKTGNGRPYIRLCTECFKRDDVDFLVQLLNNNNVECHTYSHKEGHDKNGNQKEYYAIYITCDGTVNFLNRVSKFIVPELRYKVPSGYDDYEDKSWDLGQGELFYSEIEKIDNSSSNGEQVTAFCIDVENNHNFIAGDMVVHNCTRTRDPIYPVYYTDLDGKMYKLHYTRVAYSSTMPSAQKEMNGVGFCAVSKTINAAQNLIDIATYKQEKLGSRPPRAMFITKGGLDPEDIQAAINASNESMNSQGLSRFSKTIALGNRNIPNAGLEQFDLAGVPDGFDEKESTILGMAVISLAFGMDARELFPGMESGASKADAIISHIKQRGKGPGQVIGIVERLLNQKYLPPFLKASFDYQDDSQDRQIAEIRNIRSQARQRNIEFMVTDVRVERQNMMLDGEITKAQFDELELKDGRLDNGLDVEILFQSDDKDFKEFLSGVTESNYETKEDEIGKVIMTSKDVSKIKKARQALAAIKAKFDTEDELVTDSRNTNAKPSKPDMSYQDEKIGRKLPRDVGVAVDETQNYQEE